VVARNASLSFSADEAEPRGEEAERADVEVEVIESLSPFDGAGRRRGERKERENDLAGRRFLPPM